jgi:hypothetical protein
MKQIQPHSDERLMAWCVYCGGTTATRDHVPSKILLDEPYSDNLPVVPCCQACNANLSIDEEYVAALIDSVIAGTAHPSNIMRQKIRKVLGRRPALTARLQAARVSLGSGTAFHIEPERVIRVMLKLTRGHAAFELSEPQLDDPTSYGLAPLVELNEEQRRGFEEPPRVSLFPELGSRAFQRILDDDGLHAADWITVQPGRYRYLATGADVITVRVVLSEYLACEAIWDPTA